MAEQLPVILILTPLFCGILITLLSQWRDGLALPVVLTGTAVNLIASIALLVRVSTEGTITYAVGGWSGVPAVGINLSIDSLSALVLVMISTVALLVGIYSISSVSRETAGKESSYYTLFMLLLSGLLGITASADAFNVFVMLEISSLTSYGLVAMGKDQRASVAAFNYLIIGTTGASFYLLGVGYLYAGTGMLNMADIQAVFANQPGLRLSSTILVSFILITVGFWIKMAFFPLHGWLPNAYTWCPSATSCLLAPLMTKVTVYLMMRLVISVFGAQFTFIYLDWGRFIVLLAVVAILAGSIMALAQKDFKRMLCYLIVVEVGYMVGGFWLGNRAGMTGTFFHILSDSLMTLCLFLTAGIFMQRTGSSSIESLDGIMKKMPLTSLGFIAGALAMIGIPPSCGFFSKWYLIRGGMDAGAWHYVAALLISSLINTILFFRIIEVMYFGKKPAEGHQHDHQQDHPAKWAEGPAPAVIALLITAAGLLLLGLYNEPVIRLIEQSLPGAAIVSRD